MPKPQTRAMLKLSFETYSLKATAGTPEEGTVKTMAIRSMAKAEYSSYEHRSLRPVVSRTIHAFHISHSPLSRCNSAPICYSTTLDGGKDADQRTNSTLVASTAVLWKSVPAEAERASIKYKQVEYLMTQHR